jgi:hypothetical protein
MTLPQSHDVAVEDGRDPALLAVPFDNRVFAAFAPVEKSVDRHNDVEARKIDEHAAIANRKIWNVLNECWQSPMHLQAPTLAPLGRTDENGLSFRGVNSTGSISAFTSSDLRRADKHVATNGGTNLIMGRAA